MNTSQRLSIAGKELLRGNLGNAFKSLTTTTIDPSTYRGGTGDMWMFGGAKGNDIHFSFSGMDSAITAYKKCSPIAAVINRKAQAYINGKTWVLNSKGKEAEGTEAKKLRALLKRPNRLQSWKQFEAQAYIYLQLFGYNIVLPIKPKGFPNIDATALWNIPPYMVKISENGQLFFSKEAKSIIDKVVITYKQKQQELPLDDIFIMKDFSPNFDSLVIPASRISTLQMPINNIIGAYESRNVLINYRGALGAFTHEPGTGQFSGMPIRPEDKEQLQKDFQKYGLKNNQWQFIITSASLKWQQIGVPTKDLMLFEEIDDDVMRICDTYNYPYRLLSSNKGNSLGGNELNDYKKNLYQDGIIPDAESMYEQWNQFFQLEELNLKMDKDYSHLAVLQADRVQEATARKTMNEALKIEYETGLITLNQWLIKLGEDPIENGNIKSTDVKESNQPLATMIGVGGVQSLIAIITATGMSADAKQSTLEILFGLSPADAARMVSEPTDSTADSTISDNPQTQSNAA